MRRKMRRFIKSTNRHLFRLMSVVLSVLVLTASLPLSVYAATEITASDNVNYEITSGGDYVLKLSCRCRRNVMQGQGDH